MTILICNWNHLILSKQYYILFPFIVELFGLSWYTLSKQDYF